MIQIFTPEFIVYPLIYITGPVLLIFLVRGHPGYFLAGFLVWNLFWLMLFIIFSIFYNVLPCINIAGHGIGGCPLWYF